MRFFLLLAILFFSLFCTSAWAQNQDSALALDTVEEGSEKLDILPENAVLLGEEEENGIIAMAWLYRPEPVSAEAVIDRQLPDLLFLRFLSVENNIAVEKGLVAYKLENMEGIVTSAVKMEFKNGYFVVNLGGVSPGLYVLSIGCKLEDEKKRQFRYELKIN